MSIKRSWCKIQKVAWHIEIDYSQLTVIPHCVKYPCALAAYEVLYHNDRVVMTMHTIKVADMSKAES